MENPAINTTNPSHPSFNWVGEPNQRGTFGIISLCFSTLIICIWSTLHFNVPIRRYTDTHRFFLHVFWMLIALLAPEVLLYFAIQERIKAGELLTKVLKFHPHLAKPGVFTRMYNQIRGPAEPKDVSAQCQAYVIQLLTVTEQKRYNPIEQRHFGLVHAFYAMMGGFAFYASFDDDTPKSLSWKSTNPLYPVDVPQIDTLIYIMEHFPDILADITEEDILDRAASSSLSKALLIVQVAWFCTNCASRLFQRLPLSLLEVSTAAHGLCTLLTYFVWWSKPVNVPTPTLLREKQAREVYALLKCSGDEYYKALEMAQKRGRGDSSTPTGLHKIVLAAGVLQQIPNPMRPPIHLGFNNRGRMLNPGTFNFRHMAVKGFSKPITVTISPILYGVVHFLAWSNQFPTPLERLLWRVSSLVVTCSGLVEVIIFILDSLIQDRHGTVPSMIEWLASVMFFLVVPSAHVLASGFLIVESVRQLLFLDAAAYQLPSWSNYWPHFS